VNVLERRGHVTDVAGREQIAEQRLGPIFFVLPDNDIDRFEAGLLAAIWIVPDRDLLEALGDAALRVYPESRYLLAQPADPVDLAPGVVADFLYRRSATIYGGTNEIQRNIIAAQLLKV